MDESIWADAYTLTSRDAIKNASNLFPIDTVSFSAPYTSYRNTPLLLQHYSGVWRDATAGTALMAVNLHIFVNMTNYKQRPR